MQLPLLESQVKSNRHSAREINVVRETGAAGHSARPDSQLLAMRRNIEKLVYEASASSSAGHGAESGGGTRLAKEIFERLDASPGELQRSQPAAVQARLGRGRDS